MRRRISPFFFIEARETSGFSPGWDPAGQRGGVQTPSRPSLTRTFRPGLILWVAVLFLSPSSRASIEIGPEVSVSLPQAIQIGAEGYCTEGAFFCRKEIREYLTLGGVLFPLGTTDKSLGIFAVETGVRVFPFQFPLLFGIALGYRNVGVRLDTSAFHIDDQPVATDAAANFSTLYGGPILGYRLNLGDGFFGEIDLGFQFALYSSGSMFLSNRHTGANSNNSRNLEVDSKVPMTRLSSLPLPTATVFRLIRYF